MKTYRVARLAGVQVSVAPSAVVASIALWALLSSLAVWLLPLSPGAAILGGLLAVLLHWFSEIMHQLGHAWLALFFCLENLFVFTLGAFLPLGFTDGSTLLEWWPKR